MLISSSSSFYTCIEGIKSALPNGPKYDRCRIELNAITQTPEGKYKLVAIINSLSQATFNQLEEKCASLPWPDAFKNVFETDAVIKCFQASHSHEQSNENFEWMFINFLKQHKYERAFEILSQAPNAALFISCLGALKTHIIGSKPKEKEVIKEIIEAAHALTESSCKRLLIKILFNRLILINEEQEELVLQFKSLEDKSKMLFLLSIYYFQLYSLTRPLAERYHQLMPEETIPLSIRKDKLGDYYSVTPAWTANSRNDLFANLSQITRFHISTDGDLY